MKIADPQRAVETWRKMQKNAVLFEHHVLDLVAHPEVTPEQLVSVAKKLRDMRTSLCETHNKLIEQLRWPHRELIDKPVFLKRRER